MTDDDTGIGTALQERVQAVFDRLETPRAPQMSFADSVAGFLGEDASVLLMEAATGVGKTWGYLIPALLYWAETGTTVAVSTHTLTLLRQISNPGQIAKPLDWIEAETGRRPTVAVRLGMRNFLAPSRIEAARAGVVDPDAETAAAFDSLARWATDVTAKRGGQIQEWIDQGGSLPDGVTPGDICLLGTCPTSDRAAYDVHKDKADGADLVVQTHALTLIQALRGKPPAGLLIVDEADAIPEVAAGMAERRITLDMLTSAVAAAAEAGADTAGLTAAVDQFTAWAETVRPAERTPGRDLILLPSPGADRDALNAHAGAIAAALRAIANALRAVASGRASLDRLDTELRDTLTDMAAGLERFRAIDPARDRHTGAAILWRFGALPGFAVSALRPGRLLSRLWTGENAGGVKVILTSATLDPPSDTTTAPVRFPSFEREVGIWKDDKASRHNARITPKEFGKLRFVLADRQAPKPNAARTEDEPDREDAVPTGNPEWLDYAASMIRAALAEAATAADDRTLVLATSHADAEALAERVPGLALHRRGTRLDDHIKTYLATPGAALVTPSGWAGLDLPGRIQHLVITRIPFAPPDPVEQELLRRVLTAAGYDSGTIEGAILWRRTFDDAAKRLRQGLGRALRGPDDKAKIWIADPRFPLPDAIVRDRRAGVSQGAAKTLTGLTAAIPLRFRAGMRETWSDAAIFPHVAPPVEPC